MKIRHPMTPRHPVYDCLKISFRMLYAPLIKLLHLVQSYVYMHKYICVYMYMYMYTYVYTFAGMYTYTHIHTYIHTCVNIQVGKVGETAQGVEDS